MRLFEMREAAEFLKIDYDTLRAYVRSGLIAAVRYPSLAKGKSHQPRRKKLFRQETLEKFILDNESETAVQVAATRARVATIRNYTKGWHERYQVEGGTLKRPS